MTHLRFIGAIVTIASVWCGPAKATSYFIPRCERFFDLLQKDEIVDLREDSRGYYCITIRDPSCDKESNIFKIDDVKKDFITLKSLSTEHSLRIKLDAVKCIEEDNKKCPES